MSAMPKLVKPHHHPPPLTAEQEAYVLHLIRQETATLSTIVSAIKRAVLQLASMWKDEPERR
jgi:hypothetical protein